MHHQIVDLNVQLTANVHKIVLVIKMNVTILARVLAELGHHVE